MENENENLNSSNEENENADSLNSEAEADVEVLKTQLAEIREKNIKLFERTKKAEGFILQDGKWVKPAPASKPEEKPVERTSGGLNVSLSDLAAINAAKIHPDDIERVEKFAQDEGLTLKEALKHEELKAILNVREEHRNTAAATNTGGGRQATSKDTPEAILERAAAGQLPEDDEGIKALSEARLQAKLDAIKK